MRFPNFFCLSGNKAACLYHEFVLRMNRTDECATKRVFGFSTLFFIADASELLIYFFLFRY